MDIQELVARVGRHWTEGRLAFYVGAGVSKDCPSHLPLGEELSASVLRGFTELLTPNDDRLLHELAKHSPLEEICGLIQRELRSPQRLVTTMSDALVKSAGPPNHIHRFLAQAIYSGHIVVTTNFDEQIESAYRELFGRDVSEENLSYDDDSFARFLASSTSDRSSQQEEGRLLKLHGSLRVGRRNTEGSVITTLDRVGKGLSHEAASSLARVLEQYPIVFMGYGCVDIDITYPSLLNTVSSMPLYWIEHSDKNTVVDGPQIQSLLAKEESRVASGTVEDIHFTNVLRVVSTRAKSHPSRSWISYNPVDEFVTNLEHSVGMDSSTNTPGCTHSTPWQKRLLELGKDSTEFERRMAIAKVSQALATRRPPNTGRNPEQSRRLFDLSDRMLLYASFERASGQARVRITAEATWNCYRRDPEGSHSLVAKLQRKPDASGSLRSPDPIMLSLHVLSLMRARQVSDAIASARTLLALLPGEVRQLIEAGTESNETLLKSAEALDVDDRERYGTALRRAASALNARVSDPATSSMSIGHQEIPQLDPREQRVLNEARTLAVTARLLSTSAGDTQGVIQAQNFLGLILSKLGEPNAAIEVHQTSRLMASQLGWYPELPQSIRNLGLAYESGGKIAEAIEELELARNLFEQTVGASSPDVTTTTWHMGRLMIKLGDAGGIQSIQTHLDDLKGSSDLDCHFRANDHCLIGIGLWDAVDQQEKALEHFAQMLAEYRQAFDAEPERIARLSYGAENALSNLTAAMSRIRQQAGSDSLGLVAEMERIQERFAEVREMSLMELTQNLPHQDVEAQ